ncbi:MAG: PAS domain S-box protein, partial [Candidatus Electrothrix sp. AR3]|nr:PAS domain S-box protein [Candidatus Electrothrix sp. AR3]
FHASVVSGKNFVWLHSLATLVGGLTLALIALPLRFANISYLQNIPYMSFFLSVIFGSFSLLFSELIPIMVEDDSFSSVAKIMNTIGGIGFIIAWLSFSIKKSEVAYNEQILLANQSLFFGMAGLLFYLSSSWDATWWLWHILRLFAYFVMLWFFITLYSQREMYIRKSQIKLKIRTEELGRTQRRLGDIIEYSPNVITLKNILGEFILVNKQFNQLFGYKKKELVGKTMSDLFPANIAEFNKREDEKIIRLACSTEVEEEYLLKNNETRTFIVDRFPLRGKNDDIYGIGCIMTDITERKKAERERKKFIYENNERLKELNCLYGLSRLAEYSDFDLDSILQSMVELIASSWQHAEYAGARILLNENEVYTDNFIENQWIQEAPVLIEEEVKGSVQVCYTKKFPDIDEGPFQKEERHLINEIAARLGSIMEHKIAGKELHKAFEFNNRIIEEFPIGLSIYDHNGQCIAANTSMEEFTGFTREQQLCHNYNEIDYWEKSGLCDAA